MGLVQSFVPSAKPMKFSTPIGATFGNSVQWRSPAEVWMMAVGSACAAPSREVEIITTSVCIRVRMDAPVGCFDNLRLYDKELYDNDGMTRFGSDYMNGRARRIASSNQSSGSHSGQSLLDAPLKRLVGIDRDLRISDGFEARLHLQVERERPILRWVRGVRFKIQAPPSGFIGTGALDDRPGLSEFACECQNAVDLIATGKGAAVEKDFASGSFLQQEAGSVEHDLHHEVVLLDRVFDIFWREQGGADLIFAEERAPRAACQLASECSFTGSGKAGHQNDHSVEIVAEAEFSSRFSSRLSWRRLPQWQP